MSENATPIGTVIALKGQVWVESEHGTRPLEMDGAVYQGEKVVTGPDSGVEIRFLDDTFLSQGPDSALSLKDYVYDPGNTEGANLGFGLLQGAFRHVSGKIAETNPENVQLESPLAVIGIRGTVTVHRIDPDGGGETHGVESIGPNHRVIIQDSFGEVRIISQPMTVIDLWPDQPMEFIRPLTPQEMQFFHSFAAEVLEILGMPAAAAEVLEEAGTGGQAGQAGQDGQDARDGSEDASSPEPGSRPAPEAGLTKAPIAEYEVQASDGQGPDMAAGDEEPGLFWALTPEPGADLLLPPEALGTGLDLFSSAPDALAPLQDDPFQPEPGDTTDPTIGNPANWESMTSGGHPNYSWLPAGYTAVPGTDGSDVVHANSSPGGSGPFAVFGFGGDDWLAAGANHMFYGGARHDTMWPARATTRSTAARATTGSSSGPATTASTAGPEPTRSSPGPAPTRSWVETATTRSSPPARAMR